MTNLDTALTDYITTILGSIGQLALVAAVGLALILVVYGAVRR